MSVAGYVTAALNPPYLASMGDSTEPGVAAFNYGGHWSEFLLRHTIPEEQARQAMRLFLQQDGGAPDNIVWEEG